MKDFDALLSRLFAAETKTALSIAIEVQEWFGDTFLLSNLIIYLIIPKTYGSSDL